MAISIQKISATQNNSSITFDPEVSYVIIKNVGSSPSYINVNAAATTSHFKLDAQEELEIGLSNITTIQAICDSGLSTTLNVIGSKGYWL